MKFYETKFDILPFALSIGFASVENDGQFLFCWNSREKTISCQFSLLGCDSFVALNGAKSLAQILDLDQSVNGIATLPLNELQANLKNFHQLVSTVCEVNFDLFPKTYISPACRYRPLNQHVIRIFLSAKTFDNIPNLHECIYQNIVKQQKFIVLVFIVGESEFLKSMHTSRKVFGQYENIFTKIVGEEESLAAVVSKNTLNTKDKYCNLVILSDEDDGHSGSMNSILDAQIHLDFVSHEKFSEDNSKIICSLDRLDIAFSDLLRNKNGRGWVYERDIQLAISLSDDVVCQNKQTKLFVIDTNIIVISDALNDALESNWFEDNGVVLCVPYSTVQEIDKFKLRHGTVESGRCRKFHRLMNRLMISHPSQKWVRLENPHSRRKEFLLDFDTTHDDYIVSYAVYLQQIPQNTVVFVTHDSNCFLKYSAKTDQKGLFAESFEDAMKKYCKKRSDLSKHQNPPPKSPKKTFQPSPKYGHSNQNPRLKSPKKTFQPSPKYGHSNQNPPRKSPKKTFQPSPKYGHSNRNPRLKSPKKTFQPQQFQPQKPPSSFQIPCRHHPCTKPRCIFFHDKGQHQPRLIYCRHFPCKNPSCTYEHKDGQQDLSHSYSNQQQFQVPDSQGIPSKDDFALCLKAIINENETDVKGWANLGQLGIEARKQNSAFNPTNYGKLRKFLDDYSDEHGNVFETASGLEIGGKAPMYVRCIDKGNGNCKHFPCKNPTCRFKHQPGQQNFN